MRIFELAVAGLLVVGAVWGLISGDQGRPAFKIICGVILLALVLQLTTEGSHWQIWPLYAGVLFIFVPLFSKKAALPPWNAVTVLVLVLIAICFSAALPIFRLPAPTGPYALGTRILDLADPSRAEEYDPSRRRELVIQIWYPAAPSRNHFAPYRRRVETTLLSSYQSVTPTHSRLDAPTLSAPAGGFPVLLFNPAWGGRRTQNTFLAEDLASHGYVVAAIDHPYNSEPVALPGGRVVHFAVVPQMNFESNDLQTIEAAAAKELKTQTADTIFVLNRLARMNADPESPFYERLNTNDVGAFGHSFGGAVSAQACADDPRIRAAMDLDGSLWGRVQQTGLPKPFLFISEDVAPPGWVPPQPLSNVDRIDMALNDSDDAMVRKFGAYRVYLHGSTHTSFTDSAIFSPFQRLSGRGTIPARRQFSIVRQYALAFFNQTLRGIRSPLLGAGPSPFPEAQYAVIAAQAH